MIPSCARGVIANVFTAFKPDQSFDPDGQRHFLDGLLGQGPIDNFFVRSGMGQMYTYDYDEVREMIALACAHLGGKAPVLAGCAGIWDRDRDHRPDPAVFTRQAVELSQYAQEQGAAVAVHTLPEAILPGEGETTLDVTLRYLEAVTAAIQIPVVLYQPPGTDPAFHVTAETLPVIAAMPGVAAIKVSTSDAAIISDLCWSVRGMDFGYITGDERGLLAGLCMGSVGCIGQGCCVNPAVVRAIFDRQAAGDYTGALDAQRSVNLLTNRIGNAVEFLKRYFTEKGHPVHTTGRTRRNNAYAKYPYEPMTDAQYAEWKALFEAEYARYR
jgi:dihydrodipicolinate synthase/N-acetylneuraminate lyase